MFNNNSKLDELTNLRDNYPQKINDQADFELAKKTIASILKICKPDFVILNQQFITDKFFLSLKNTVEWSKNNANINDQVYCKFFCLNMSVKSVKIKEIVEYGSELLKLQEYLTADERSDLIGSLSSTYENIQAYNEMLDLLPYKIKDIKNNPTKYQAGYSISYELSFIYYKMKRYDLAIDNFLIQKKAFIKAKNWLMISSMSNNIGLCYSKNYEYNKALIYFRLALDELSQDPSKNQSDINYNLFFESNIKSNIAQIEIRKGNYKGTIATFNLLKNRTLAFLSRERSNVTDAYLNLSKIYLAQKKPLIALKYADSCYKTIDNLRALPIKIEVKKIKAKIYLSLGENDKAIKMFYEIDKSNDSISQIQLAQNTMLAQVKFNVDEQEKKYQSIKTDLKNSDANSYKQKIGLGFGAVLIAIIGFLYYQKIKNSKIIDVQNEILKINLNEKEMLLKEVHHRVKNNLQVITGLLQLQASKNESPEIELMLQNSERQINSIALMHQMLYQNEFYSIVSIKEYIQKLTDQLLFSSYGTNYKIKIDVDDVTLSTDVVIPIGLIISELFINSYKHAFKNNKGTIEILLHQTVKNNFEFVYRDNGVGFSNNNTSDKTMGFNLLKMLAEEISGTITINGNNGFEAIIKFIDHEKK